MIFLVFLSNFELKSIFFYLESSKKAKIKNDPENKKL